MTNLVIAKWPNAIISHHTIATPRCPKSIRDVKWIFAACEAVISLENVDHIVNVYPPWYVTASPRSAEFVLVS